MTAREASRLRALVEQWREQAREHDLDGERGRAFEVRACADSLAAGLAEMEGGEASASDGWRGIASAPKDGTQAAKAEAIARALHYGATTGSEGLPYITHVERVAAAVEGDEAKAVAWLHDVVEDTPVTLAALRAAGFSDAVVIAVALLTRMEGEPYDVYVRRIALSNSLLARVVKVADLTDNLRPSCPDRLRARYEPALALLKPLLVAAPPGEGDPSSGGLT